MKKAVKRIGLMVKICVPILVLLQCTPKKSEDPLPILAKSYVEILQKDTSLKVGEMLQLKAKYVNEQDETSTNVAFLWSATNATVIDLSNSGLVKGKGIGQSYVYLEFAGKRDTILFTILPSVSGSNTDTTIATILIILEESNSVKIGEDLQLTAKAYNSSGFELTGKVFTWTSSSTNIGTISGTGLFSGLAIGNSNISVSSQSIQSIALQISVTNGEASSRNGNFVGKDGHSCSGSASIYKDNGGNLKIDFASNFVCQGGPDLRVYLTNSASGGGVITNGIELALLKSNSGVQTYSVPSNVKIGDYSYVVVHCKQFNVSFGSAQFD